jgi:outer membrane protein OmpA-like peptidoglycan-associated protein
MKNILETINDYISPDVVGKLSEKTGESSSAVTAGLGALVPSILGGILGKSSDSGLFSTIFSMLKSSDSGILSNLTGLLGDSASSHHDDPKDAAGSLLGKLFGNKVPELTSGVSKITGMQDSSVGTLLGLAGPLVTGVLGKKINSENLSESGFSNFMSSQKDVIGAAMPAGLGGVLGLGSLGNIGANISGQGARVGASVSNAAASASAPAAGGGKGLGWLWVPIIGAVGVGGYFLAKNFMSKPEPNPTENVTTMGDSLSSGDSSAEGNMTSEETTSDADANASTNFSKKLPNGFELMGNPGGVEDSLVSFIESSAVVNKTSWFNFDRLLFKTGSSVLDMESSKEQLTNAAEILKAYPKVKLKIGGYTDNVGKEESNKKLSADRAAAVVKALVDMGISKDRLDPEGYGSQHPVASNDTEEGRAQNRRIAVRVKEK